MRLKFKRIIKKVLKSPPKGTEIKEFHFRKLSNDEIFVLSVKLSAYDIGVLKSDKENCFGTYLISEFEKAKKRLEEEKRLNDLYARNFKKFLDNKKIYISDYYIKRTVEGYMPFYSTENDLFREFLGTSFAREEN